MIPMNVLSKSTAVQARGNVASKHVWVHYKGIPRQPAVVRGHQRRGFGRAESSERGHPRILMAQGQRGPLATSKYLLIQVIEFSKVMEAG